MQDANAKPDEAAAVDVAMQLRLAIMEGAGQLAEGALAEIERLRRVAEVLRCFPLPSQSASTTENYRNILEWLYRDSTDRLICGLAAEAEPEWSDAEHYEIMRLHVVEGLTISEAKLLVFERRHGDCK